MPNPAGKIKPKQIKRTTPQGYNARFHNISQSLLAESLAFHPRKGSTGQWGVELETIEGIPPVFHQCYLDPFLPEALEHRVRSCSSSPLISSCPIGTEDQAAERCASYTGLVYSEDQAFRNTHCALCHGVNISSLICLKLEGRRLGFLDYFKPLSFAVLFDVSGKGEEVGEEELCSIEEVWDPFFKKCRNVVCGQEGWQWAAGACWPPGELPTTTTTQSTTSTTTTSTTTTTTTSTTTTIS